ncbi:MAG: FlgD immunoglobulin-like domain containing protein [Candidatus Krumholzibacteriia bacterium]
MKKSCISGAALAVMIILAGASILQAAGLADAFTLTVYEQTGSINAYTFLSSDPLLYAKRAGYPGPEGWGGSGYDFGTGGCEYYDLFFSDSLGNLLALSPGDALPVPAYLTLVCMDFSCNTGTIIPAPNWVSAGNNLDAVKINYGGTDYWANGVLQATYGLCDEPFSAKTSNFADEALGPQDGGITKMGCGLTTLTLRLGNPAPAPPDTTLEHDPMYANTNPFFDWREKEAAWYPEFDGYMNVTDPSWYNGIISGRAFDESQNVVMIGRIYRGSFTNYIFGFTNVPADSSDFHYSNIDLGIYVHSTGSIRPAWDVDNAGYWSTTIPEGYYDIRIKLNRDANTVSYAIVGVDSYSDPLSDFTSPLWSAEESRPIAGDYHIQINPYSIYGAVFDVWCSSASVPVPPDLNPKIASIGDVGNDQGGKVRIKWQASPYDTLGSAKPITAYAIWRRIDPLPLAMQDFAPLGASGDAMFMYPPGEWDYVASVPACCEKTYLTLVPTLADSTILHGMYYSVFYVRALTATPGDYLDSPVDSGYSVDNVAPAQPEGLQGVQVAGGLKITWAPSTDPDFSHFILSKGTCENDPAPGVLETLAGTSYIDETWTPQSNAYYYILSAVDRSGNIGVCSELAPDENVATLLQNFSVNVSDSGIELVWQLSRCDEQSTFAVLRAKDPGGEYEELPASGLVRNGLGFAFRDTGCEPGVLYRYRVECADGSSRFSLFDTESIAMPAMPLALHQNSPNPFNPSTTIRYYLPERMWVRLDVYDVSGRLVARLADEEQERGDRVVQWDGRGMRGDRVSSGVYYCRLQAGKDVISRTMVLLR